MSILNKKKKTAAIGTVGSSPSGMVGHMVQKIGASMTTSNSGSEIMYNLDYPATQDLEQAKDTVTRFFKDRYNYQIRPETLDSEANTWISFGNEAYHKYVNWWDNPIRKPKANIAIKPTSPIEGLSSNGTAVDGLNAVNQIKALTTAVEGMGAKVIQMEQATQEAQRATNLGETSSPDESISEEKPKTTQYLIFGAIALVLVIVGVLVIKK